MYNKQQMSVFGVGPKLAIWTLAFFVLVFITNSYYSELFRINFISRGVLIAIGISLLVLGLTLHVLCGKTILEIHKKDVLSTGGVFRVCRHPMYSAWMFSNLPGIGLLLGSWLFLSVPVFMYIIFRLLIKTEEKYLKQRYGKDYDEYRNRINLSFPCVWRLISR